jgi:predicted nucleotidyltransferase
VKIIYPNREAILRRLKQITRQIKTQHPEVVSVRLFGSLARDNYTATSDADLIIVLSHSAENDPHRRIMTFLPYFDLRCGVDLLVYTQREIESRLSEGDPFLRRVWQESTELAHL